MPTFRFLERGSIWCETQIEADSLEDARHIFSYSDDDLGGEYETDYDSFTVEDVVEVEWNDRTRSWEPKKE